MLRRISLDEAKPIWDRFVPDKQVWTDDWDIRVALCNEFGYEPLILYDGSNFFPLQYEPEAGFYSIIGGTTAERNPLTFDPEFMKATKEIPEDVYFDFLTEKFDGCIEGVCPQFFIDLTSINSIDDYIQRFSGKHRKNFRNSYKKFGDYEFRRHGTLKEMAALNVLVFGEKSDFASGNPDDSVCYHILDRDPRTEYWSIFKDGEVASILQYFFYNKTMSVCLWGVDAKHTDTRKVALTEEIKLARSRGCNRIDYAPMYSSWKFLYRLDTAPLWRHKRGNIPDSVDAADYGIPPEERERLRAQGRP